MLYSSAKEKTRIESGTMSRAVKDEKFLKVWARVLNDLRKVVVYFVIAKIFSAENFPSMACSA